MQYDKLNAISKIAAVNAISALSKLLALPMTIDVKMIEIKKFHEVSAFFSSITQSVSIDVSLTEAFSGASLLILPNETARSICDILFHKEEGKTRRFTERDKSGLIEIGNIITGNFLSSFAIPLQMGPLKYKSPHFNSEKFPILLDKMFLNSANLHEKSFLSISFSFHHKVINGMVFFLFYEKEMRAIAHQMEKKPEKRWWQEKNRDYFKNYPPQLHNSDFTEYAPNPIIELNLDGIVTYLNLSAYALFTNIPNSTEHPLLKGLMAQIDLAINPMSELIILDRVVTFFSFTYEQKIFAYPQKNSIFIYMTDITLRAYAEKTIKELNKKLESLTKTLKKTNEKLVTKNAKLQQLAKELKSAYRTLQEKESKIEYLAYHDYLTGIANRLQFERLMNIFLARAKRYQKKIGLILLDLDRFKQVNDNMGHEIGDLLLKSVTKRFKSIIRESDTLVRLGGDEFAVLTDIIDTVEDVYFFEHKLIDILKAPFILNQYSITISASIGIAIYPDEGKTIVQLMRSADAALYRAKRLVEDSE